MAVRVGKKRELARDIKQVTEVITQGKVMARDIKQPRDMGGDSGTVNPRMGKVIIMMLLLTGGVLI